MADTSMAIDKRSLDLRATEIIRERILSGTLRPGERIMENDVAADLGLSRGTIRSALQRLVVEELIVQVPYSGWRVPEFTEHDAWELRTVRNALEGVAARLAAENLDETGRQLLEAAYRDLLKSSETGDLVLIAEADLNLHRTIMLVSGNTRLYRFFTLVEHQVRLLIAQSNAGWSGSPQEIGKEHEQLVAAILSGDADLAERMGRAP